ncbi:isoprenylcysteine carboxylmethyltransferase family protein, partial [Candidatus Parcubacteria bacterium]|nr:isoprenylcysteine carboxylmethyltransferase family protein [Candidatus Parcubacteria bacterium]
FTRNPTYVGLTLLTFGFALVLNSWPVLVGALLSLYVVGTGIVRKEEALMEKKYGAHYVEYKKKVRAWF